ncbi:MAG: hypothetical protein CVV18_01895 [Gammaproteobacteria bacterium HGW-Gammaproteobacteria-8]|nr:MAG: hypothetical protein CVV18_01895 [Gammaproteobacteria bacterium HGW-Gammaproteobacteria-8]
MEEQPKSSNFFDAHARVRRAREKFLNYAQFRYRQFINDPQQQPHAVACVHLNNWQGFRDRFGYAGLERLNHQIEAILLPTLEPRDLCARFSDNALVAILCGEHGSRDPQDWAEQVLQQLAEHSFKVEDTAVSASFSIGLCWFDRRVHNAEEALADATHIAELLSIQGQNQIRQFQPADTAQASSIDDEKMSMLIRNSLDTSQLRVVFQPLIGWDNDQRRCYQAWARLIDDDGRELRAREFLEVARRSGILPRLNRWTLRRAVHFVASDPSLRQHMQLLLNVSIETFDERSLQWLEQNLRDHPHCRDCLIAEFDEFEFTSRRLESEPLAARLKAAGLRLALSGIGPGNLPRCREHFGRVEFLRMTARLADELDGNPMLESEFIDIIDEAHRHGLQIIMPELSGEEQVVESFKRGVDLIQSDFLEHPRELLRAAIE